MIKELLDSFDESKEKCNCCKKYNDKINLYNLNSISIKSIIPTKVIDQLTQNMAADFIDARKICIDCIDRVVKNNSKQ